MGYFKKFNASEGIAFMDGADKGDFKELEGALLHFADYAYIRNADGDYAVMTFAEIKGRFYFGNQIITEALHQVDADGQKGALLDGSVAIKFFKRVAEKSKREYWAFEFVEADEKVPF